jgi:hypothetical protein
MDSDLGSGTSILAPGPNSRDAKCHGATRARDTGACPRYQPE